MKLTDFLQDVGRPVAYYPELRKITGSVTATILLCQFIYWRGKESGGDGWLYKTADDIQEETGLTYGEQKTARRDLVAVGMLEEHYARLDHQMRFKINLDTINEKWGNGVSNNGESGKPTFGNDAKPLSLNESEITAENTTKPPVFKKEKPDLIDLLLEQGKQSNELQQACNVFESSLGFGVLNWDTRPEWRRFAKWVLTEVKRDGGAFTDYAKWREGVGKYKAMSNNKIRQNPEMFIDTGWPTFLAHSSMNAMYARSEPEEEGL